MHKVFQIYKLLLPYLWFPVRCRIATFLTILFIATDVISTTYFPYLWKDIIATLPKQAPTSWFVSAVTVLFLAWVTKKVSPHLREIFFFKVTNQAIKDLRYKTILKSHKISLENLKQYNLLEIISSTNRVSQSIRHFMRVSFISILPNSFKAITLSTALYFSHAYSFWIVIIALTSLILASLLLKAYTQTKLKGWHMTDNLAVAMNHSLQNTKSVRFYLKKESSFLLNLFNAEADAWERNNLAYYSLHLMRDFAFYLGVGITFTFITLQYSSGSISLDTLVLIYGLITSLHTPLLEMSRNMMRFLGGIADLTKTLEILALPDEDKPIHTLPLTPQSMVLNQVSFAYSPTQPILNRINLTINPGDKIGIFGPSGTGKSTLCQILSGLIPPDDGDALYGELPLYNIPPEKLGKHLCYIPQDHWSKDLDILDHPYGFRLRHKITSGGEYQRYLLDKMLAERPQVIILDETTNALDRHNIDLAINKIIQTVPTVIMITHRQSTLKRMHRIFQLKHATLTEITENHGKTPAK